MKAILILDEMPESCEMCYLCRMREHGRFCVITKEYDHEVGCVQKNCPLKPMPKKLLILGHYQDNELLNSEEVAYAKGRNACIDEMLEGEKE